MPQRHISIPLSNPSTRQSRMPHLHPPPMDDLHPLVMSYTIRMLHKQSFILPHITREHLNPLTCRPAATSMRFLLRVTRENEVIHLRSKGKIRSSRRWN